MSILLNSYFISSLRHLSSVLLAVVLLCPAIVLAEHHLSPEQIEGVTRVTAEEIFDLVVNEPDLMIIDSRKPERFSKGHIQDALNILDSEMTESQLAKIVASKSVPVVFYCNGEKCLRSANAAVKAYDWGYRKIYWFRGGWNEWMKKEMPVSQLSK